MKKESKKISSAKISAGKARGIIALILLLLVFQVVTFILHKIQIGGGTPPDSLLAAEKEVPLQTLIAEKPKSAPEPKIYKKTAPSKPKKQVLVELNSADSADLVSVRGIGPFYARQIVQYRERLGGYVSKEQLLELYKMDRERYEPIAEQITVNSLLAQKIDFKALVFADGMSKEELKKMREFLGRHPYIGYHSLKGMELYMKSLPLDSLKRVSSEDLLKAFVENGLIIESNCQRLLLYIK